MYQRTAILLVALGFVALSLLTGCTSRSGAGAATPRNGWSTYGEAQMGEGDAVAIGALAGGEQNVVVHGTIVEVCAVKGCWMTLRDDEGQELFVKFKDYGFFVPRNAAGRRVVVQGWVERKAMSVEELQHYAHDAGRSEQEIAAITEPRTQITFYANSVMIEGRGLQKPYEKRPGDECY